MNIIYLWSKLIKKLPGSSIKDTVLEKPSKIEARSTVLQSSFGRYSYCGYGCTIINAEIGRFCSIADNVTVGLSHHPVSWVSTSCAFYKGKDSIPKDLAQLDYDSFPKKTHIGNDVWIGNGAILKQGITVGNGAIIGMGSIVTKDVPPYAIVGGNPARIIRYRFDDDTIQKLQDLAWWDYSKEQLKQVSHMFNDTAAFIQRIESL